MDGPLELFHLDVLLGALEPLRQRLDGVFHAQVLLVPGHHFDQPVAGLFEQGEILDGGPLIAGGGGQRHPDPIFQQVIDLRVGPRRARGAAVADQIGDGAG